MLSKNLDVRRKAHIQIIYSTSGKVESTTENYNDSEWCSEEDVLGQ